MHPMSQPWLDWRPISEAPKRGRVLYGKLTQFGEWTSDVYLWSEEPLKYGFTHFAEIPEPQP